MANYREIIRLRSMEYSRRQIAASVHSSQDTISEVLTLADEKGLSWPLPDDLIDPNQPNRICFSNGVTNSRLGYRVSLGQLR